MNKKIKQALRKGSLVDFDKLFASYSKSKKEEVLKKARYLKIAIALRKLRQGANLTQEKLAQKMKVEREFIARIESGRQNVTLETLYRIAGAVNKQFNFQFK
ncbi:helix-turn-helix domain-containing protein [Patescibacteria group bacterium]|nr:helix-turn-helix domain-containing protein [Patescibacteria group bacterium]